MLCMLQRKNGVTPFSRFHVYNKKYVLCKNIKHEFSIRRIILCTRSVSTLFVLRVRDVNAPFGVL
jgi:hypothetical protein